MPYPMKPSHQEFRGRYIAFLKDRLHGRAIKLPQGYMHNCRTWDYQYLLEAGDFNDQDTVLECGALNTFFCIYLSEYVKRLIATDSYYWANRSFAKELQSPREWELLVKDATTNQLDAMEADMRDLPFKDGWFDKVVSISTIEHVDDDARGMAEMVRVLKPGGLLLLTTEFNDAAPKPYSEEDGSYHRIYNKADIDRLCQGLTVEEAFVSQTPEQILALPGRWKFTTLFLRLRKP